MCNNDRAKFLGSLSRGQQYAYLLLYRVRPWSSSQQQAVISPNEPRGTYLVQSQEAILLSLRGYTGRGNRGIDLVVPQWALPPLSLGVRQPSFEARQLVDARGCEHEKCMVREDGLKACNYSIDNDIFKFGHDFQDLDKFCRQNIMKTLLFEGQNFETPQGHQGLFWISHESICLWKAKSHDLR